MWYMVWLNESLASQLRITPLHGNDPECLLWCEQVFFLTQETSQGAEELFSDEHLCL